jgi:hypothetical protein
MIGVASEKSVYMLADSLVSALKDPHNGGHRRRHREQMQRFILAQHEDQGSPRLLHCHGDGTIGEALAQLTDPGLHRFRGMFQLAAPASPIPQLASTTHAFYILSAQSMPMMKAANCGSCLTDSTSEIVAFSSPYSIRITEGWLCSCEFLIVES